MLISTFLFSTFSGQTSQEACDVGRDVKRTLYKQRKTCLLTAPMVAATVGMKVT